MRIVSDTESASRDLITEDALRKRLTTTRYGRNILAFDRAGSTNDIAREYALQAQSNPDGTLVIADYQTRGRGRFDRHWFSPPNTNLLFSLVVCPESRLPRPALLTLAMGVSVSEGVATVTRSRCRLKWPNDVYLNGKKLGGVLTESGVSASRRPFWIVGVGVNVNASRDAFPDDVAETATSLYAELEQETSRPALLAAILATYEAWCDRLFAGDAYRLLDSARRLTATLGETVTVRRDGATLTGVAFNLDDDGALLVRTPMGRVMTVMTNDDFAVVGSPIREWKDV
jgi:BirA family biotin operon repressor/biotin-[acetyl-CoA-carboxylase] ligase